MKKKISAQERNMRNQICEIIMKAMGHEDSVPDDVEIVQFLQRNQQKEALWLCLAGVVDGKKRFDCLERALRINPQNKATFNCMKKVNHKRAYKVARQMKLFDLSIESQQPDTIDGAQ